MLEIDNDILIFATMDSPRTKFDFLRYFVLAL